MSATEGIAPRTAELIQGPYYVAGAPIRSDIREGVAGLPLELDLKLVDAASGRPLPGLAVDIWHADAVGRYSGYDNDPDAQPLDVRFQPPTGSDTFLRGRQLADADGRLRFVTVYPGWYASRTPHIHLKVFDGLRCVLTTQLFLAEADSEAVFQRAAPYARRVARDTRNGTDVVIARAHAEVDGCWVAIRNEAGGLHGDGVLSLIPAQTSEPVDAPPGFRPPIGGVAHDKRVR